MKKFQFYSCLSVPLGEHFNKENQDETIIEWVKETRAGKIHKDNPKLAGEKKLLTVSCGELLSPTLYIRTR